MTDNEERCCNTCAHYEPRDWFCMKDKELHTPNEPPCERWSDWEDTDER